MSVDVPTTIWSPTSGNGELSLSNNALIDTESGLDIITESGLSLIIEDSTFTKIPASVWIEDDNL